MQPKRKRTKYLAWMCGLVLSVTLWSSPVYAQDAPDTVEVAATDVAPDTAAAMPEGAAPAPEVASVEKAVEVAPEVAAPTALSKLSSTVMDILIPAFMVLIGLLVTFLLNWVRMKLKLNVSDAQLDVWAKIAEKAANRGAEWARAKAKEAVKGKKVPGPEVLEVAVDWALEMGIAFGLPQMGREKLIGLIESHLFSQRKDVVL